MGASASMPLCSGDSSVKILKSTAKVSPEPVCTLIPEPESSCVFGVALETLREDGQMVCGVPAVLKDMVDYLNNNGLQHRGLFRLCGSVVRMRTLRQRWDRGENVDLQNDGDVPTVASLLKLFFRELPVPIVPEPLRKHLIHSLYGKVDDCQANQSLKECLHHLPTENSVILSYLITFLTRVATHNQLNHMPMENLATIFGPCIFHVPAGPRMIEEQSASNALLLHLLKHHTTLFPNQAGQQQLKSGVELSSTPPPSLSALSHIQIRPGSCQSEQSIVQRLDEETASSTSSFTQATQMQSRLNSPDLLDFETSSGVSIPALSDRQDRAGAGDYVSPCLTAPGSAKESAFKVSSSKSSQNFMGDSCNANQEPENHKMLFTTPREWEKEEQFNCQMDAKATVPSDMDRHNTPQHAQSPHCFTEQRKSDTCRRPQSPSLKLQALDADSGPSSSPAKPRVPEDSPAQQQPFTCEEKKLPLLFHLPLSMDHSTAIPTQSVNGTSPSSPESTPVSPAALSEADARSPNAAYASPLLSHITTGDCPVPSPRCPSISHSLRYSLDPDTAPSPPSAQEARMTRSNVHAEAEEGGPSVTMLNRHIHYLRKRIRRFEERFEQERHYKPAHNDKTANPEVARLMKELIKSRKQLKELKLKQSIKGQGDGHQSCKTTHDQRGSALGGLELQLNHNGNIKPNVEETVNIITNRLKERRRELELPESLKEMSHFQIALEKTCLQKCLLYYEGLHGRPSTRQERTLMKPFYDRYRAVKQLQNSCSASTVISTIAEEEGSDEDSPKPTSPRPLPHWVKTHTLSSDTSHLELSETPLVSPLDEANGLQSQLITMATLHEASRAELLNHLKMARSEKRQLHQALRDFEEHFYSQTGRVCQKEDRGPMAEEYCQYKNLKAKLRLLEALLSKQQDVTCSS